MKDIFLNNIVPWNDIEGKKNIFVLAAEVQV